ncbi:MAG TPA: hypothetical protein VM534_04440 [Thermoanaerobaculia bacterium]|nr:hypothetical protein [Thermoanaerobaculia bacterium]
MKSKPIVLLFVVMALAAPLLAQGPPITGTADVVLSTGSTEIRPGEQFAVNVNVDLTGVTGTCDTATVDAVLNSYVIPIEFDSTRVQFLSAVSCGDPFFSADPSATNAATANANEEVIISSTISDPNNPTGDICVATLTFAALTTGETDLTVDLVNGFSLSSAFQDCAEADPTAIAATSSPLTLNITNPVPLLPLPSLALLAALLAMVGFFAVNRRG